MIAYYNKTIIVEEKGEKTYVTIFDEKSHTPVTYSLNKLGMEDMLDLFNKGKKDEE